MESAGDDAPKAKVIIPAITKRKWSALKKMFVSSIVIVFILIALTVLYIIIPPPYPDMVPPIPTNKDNSATSTTWTVWSKGLTPILKSDVYVSLWNESSWVISREPLLIASGTHGFNYASNSTGLYITAGDVFSLSKDYAIGSEISLVTENGMAAYATLTV